VVSVSDESVNFLVCHSIPVYVLSNFTWANDDVEKQAHFGVLAKQEVVIFCLS
jgi:hypothetical protein